MFRLNVTSRAKLFASIELTSQINYPTSVVHKLRTSDTRERSTFEAVEIITVALHENSKLRPTESRTIVKASFCRDCYNGMLLYQEPRYNGCVVHLPKKCSKNSAQRNIIVAIILNTCLTKSLCIAS